MATVKYLDYDQAPERARAVFDDIMETRGVDWVNNVWKALANDPPMLERTWERVKTVMGPGALDPVVKELVYLAVSASNGCEYCVYSHTAAARKKGVSEAQLMELMAVVGLANELNRVAQGLQLDVDPAFKPDFGD